MSEATYDALFDLRGQLEQNLLAAIVADLSSYTRLNAGVFQKNRPRIEAVVKIGSPNGHRKNLSATDRRYDQFHFSLSLEVITAATAALTQNDGESDAAFAARQEQQNNLHGQMVSHVDAFLSQLQLSSVGDTAAFPNLTLLYLRGAGHQPALKPEEGTEQTKLNFTGQFGIRDSAWTQPVFN